MQFRIVVSPAEKRNVTIDRCPPIKSRRICASPPFQRAIDSLKKQTKRSEHKSAAEYHRGRCVTSKAMGSAERHHAPRSLPAFTFARVSEGRSVIIFALPRTVPAGCGKNRLLSFRGALFAEESLRGLDSDRREILRFAQNDTKIEFFRALPRRERTRIRTASVRVVCGGTLTLIEFVRRMRCTPTFSGG